MTPVHVISKSLDFLNEFSQYGFVEELSKIQQTVKHEGLYSIFLRSFLSAFASSNVVLPQYEPDGIQL
jgi:hypothetical protein